MAKPSVMTWWSILASNLGICFYRKRLGAELRFALREAAHPLWRYLSARTDDRGLDQYAQSQTAKPVKGMLTGPITMLMWSFVRDDQPRADHRVATGAGHPRRSGRPGAAGIGMIQIDEPAFREGLPLKKARLGRISAMGGRGISRCRQFGVKDDTQIHTHMCYSEFNDILPAIAEMDADVITIETSRSRMELLDGFGQFKYPNEIGPGVYDIHSPRIPQTEEMVELLEKACQVIDPEQLWVNPDCGLKTRTVGRKSSPP